MTPTNAERLKRTKGLLERYKFLNDKYGRLQANDFCVPLKDVAELAESVETLVAENERLRKLVAKLVGECEEHNSEYHHRTSKELLQEAHAALRSILHKYRHYLRGAGSILSLFRTQEGTPRRRVGVKKEQERGTPAVAEVATELEDQHNG